MELLDDMSGFDQFDTQVSPWSSNGIIRRFGPVACGHPLSVLDDGALHEVPCKRCLVNCWLVVSVSVGMLIPIDYYFYGHHLCYAPNSFEMIVGTLILGHLYSTFWPSTMLGCYNLMSLGLPTQKRVWWPSAGIRLSGNVGFRHFSALFT